MVHNSKDTRQCKMLKYYSLFSILCLSVLVKVELTSANHYSACERKSLIEINSWLHTICRCTDSRTGSVVYWELVSQVSKRWWGHVSSQAPLLTLLTCYRLLFSFLEQVMNTKLWPICPMRWSHHHPAKAVLSSALSRQKTWGPLTWTCDVADWAGGDQHTQVEAVPSRVYRNVTAERKLWLIQLIPHCCLTAPGLIMMRSHQVSIPKSSQSFVTLGRYCIWAKVLEF